MNPVLRRVRELDWSGRAAMRALLCRHFAEVTDEGFEADLAEKDWVLTFERDGELVGFSTMALYPFRHAGETLTVVYSGDTIVDPSAWGTNALPRSWIHAVRRLHSDYGTGRLVWLLITSGYRTYRFLPVFWRDFHPRHDALIPVSVASLRDALALDRFGDAYDPANGVVRLPRPQPLREHLAGVPPERMGNPHIAYFERVNPGHCHGDELVCLTELSDANLTRAGVRMVGERPGAARS